MSTPPIIIGIGIRGVIIDSPKTASREDPFGGKDPLYVPKVEGSFLAIKKLTAVYPVIVIAKAGAVVQRKANDWFEDQKFFTATELPRGNIFYVGSRKEKAEIARKQGVTHFIDSRLETLSFMRGSVPNLIAFNAGLNQRERYKDVSEEVVHVDSWEKILKTLLPTEAQVVS